MEVSLSGHRSAMPDWPAGFEPSGANRLTTQPLVAPANIDGARTDGSGLSACSFVSRGECHPPPVTAPTPAPIGRLAGFWRSADRSPRSARCRCGCSAQALPFLWGSAPGFRDCSTAACPGHLFGTGRRTGHVGDNKEERRGVGRRRFSNNSQVRFGHWRCLMMLPAGCGGCRRT
jgi:hypothetical protein